MGLVLIPQVMKESWLVDREIKEVNCQVTLREIKVFSQYQGTNHGTNMASQCQDTHRESKLINQYQTTLSVT